MILGQRSSVIGARDLEIDGLVIISKILRVVAVLGAPSMELGSGYGVMDGCV